MFITQIISILEALHCQTSPSYPALRYGDPDKHITLDFAGEGGLLYKISSALLFWQEPSDSCLAVNMIPSTQDPRNVKGSLSFLWPVFQTLCLSQFIETLSCSVQGRAVMTETGMSIFEHSLAFAEAEAMVSTQLGLSPFGNAKSGRLKKLDSVGKDAENLILISKSAFFDRLNTPPEVLLMALISCLNNLSSQVLGVLGLQGRFRLINTGIWGLCFMVSFIWGFSTFSLEAGVDAGILRFPTVCIVGFIPHLLILVGIAICFCIYSIALLLSAVSPPPGLPPPRTWRERLQMAQQNLQVNIQLSTLHFNMHEDFYTALLRIGFAALTAASEAVYLNEGRRIGVGHWTWLEEERANELEQSRAPARLVQGNLRQHLDVGGLDPVASGIMLTEDQSPDSPNWKSGYGRERNTKSLRGNSNGNSAAFGSDGVGALQRGGRYIMAWEFLTGIFWLVSGWMALGLAKTMERIGISRRPAWISQLLGRRKPSKRPETADKAPQPGSLDFWLLSDEGVLSLPDNDDVDVEAETKKRLHLSSGGWGETEEVKLNTTLYEWWINGGWWGTRDESGEYSASRDEDDDDTSVVSVSTSLSELEVQNGWTSSEDSTSESGRRTPTQRDQLRGYTRSPSPSNDISFAPSQLARLLDPRTEDDRQEARILAQHLNSDRIVTRSQSKHSQFFEKAHVLTSSRYRPLGFRPSSASGKLTPFEETEVLEHLLLTRRSQGASSLTEPESSNASTKSTWKEGADGLGASGPQCVVCQSSPRTIVAWPCRCLSLCEECRVSLAMNNFGTCVCCRQDVVGFSRLYVP